MPTAMDLVQNTMDKKPGEFNNNFSELVTDRVRDIIAGKRVELAQNFFGSPPPDPKPDPDDVDDDLDTDDGDDGNDDDQTDDVKETDDDGEDTD